MRRILGRIGSRLRLGGSLCRGQMEDKTVKDMIEVNNESPNDTAEYCSAISTIHKRDDYDVGMQRHNTDTVEPLSNATSTISSIEYEQIFEYYSAASERSDLVSWLNFAEHLLADETETTKQDECANVNRLSTTASTEVATSLASDAQDSAYLVAPALSSISRCCSSSNESFPVRDNKLRRMCLPLRVERWGAEMHSEGNLAGSCDNDNQNDTQHQQPPTMKRALSLSLKRCNVIVKDIRRYASVRRQKQKIAQVWDKAYA